MCNKYVKKNWRCARRWRIRQHFQGTRGQNHECNLGFVPCMQTQTEIPAKVEGLYLELSRVLLTANLQKELIQGTWTLLTKTPCWVCCIHREPEVRGGGVLQREDGCQ